MTRPLIERAPAGILFYASACSAGADHPPSGLLCPTSPSSRVQVLKLTLAALLLSQRLIKENTYYDPDQSRLEINRILLYYDPDCN
jgi:hypothetical protein